MKVWQRPWIRFDDNRGNVVVVGNADGAGLESPALFIPGPGVKANENSTRTVV